MRIRSLFGIATFGLFFAVGLTGCFTGIESTPKITQKDVRRETGAVSPERVLSDSLLMGGLSAWKSGKCFVVTDSRLSRVFEGYPEVEAGDTLVYTGVERIPSVMGDSVARLSFTDGSRLLHYRLPSSLGDIQKRRSLDIPFAVDLDLVDNVSERLTGRTFYILTSRRVTCDGKDAFGEKYVPVRITGVRPGEYPFPLMIEFESPDRQLYMVKMNVADDGQATRCFADLFAFNDPHLRYPQISDEVWGKIRQSKVEEGMTRDECRLALGTPSDVNKWHNNSSFFERWTYENGSYLVFEDGLLSTFRI